MSSSSSSYLEAETSSDAWLQIQFKIKAEFTPGPCEVDLVKWPENWSHLMLHLIMVTFLFQTRNKSIKKKKLVLGMNFHSHQSKPENIKWL